MNLHVLCLLIHREGTSSPKVLHGHIERVKGERKREREEKKNTTYINK